MLVQSALQPRHEAPIPNRIHFDFFLNLSAFASNEAKSDHLSAIPSTLAKNNRAQFAQEMNGEMSNYWKNLGALRDDNSHFQHLYLLLSDAKSRAQSPNTIHIGLLPLPYSKKEFLAWVYWESTPDRSKHDRSGFFLNA